MTLEHVTIYGVTSAYVLSTIPESWLSSGEKLVYGAIASFVAGLAYKAGGWLWDRVTKKAATRGGGKS